MKHYLSLVLLLGVVASLSSQGFTYRLYDTPVGNLGASSIRQLADGNFLLVANRDCYTPGSITIEGCPYSPDFISIDGTGNTVWRTTLNRIQWAKGLLHENNDGTFSYLTGNREIWICENIGIGLTGLNRMLGLKLDNNGILTNETIFNDECEIYLIDALITLDDHIVRLEEFSTLFGPDVETRIINSDFDFNPIWNTIIDNGSSSSPVQWGNLVGDANGTLYVFKKDSDADSLYLVSLDANGNPVTAKAFAELESQAAYFMDAFVSTTSDIITLVRYSMSLNRFVTLYCLTTAGDLKWKYSVPTLNGATMLETIDQKLLLAVPFVNPDIDSKDVRMLILNMQGDSLGQRIYDVHGDDDPVDIIQDADERIIIMGNANCCNYDTMTGAGQVFVVWDTTALSVAVSNVSALTAEISIYPNPTSERIFVNIGNQDSVHVRLLNASGAVLFEQFFTTSGSIDLSKYPAGCYVVQGIEGHKATSIQKLIKL
ncbi:MAG TPA: T9SS type A sorting domain-containing protein [Saprospiraceae bacterium]|nr:T9SS type A sorting domain-containing protein [Saprospiraceae bacterium]